MTLSTRERQLLRVALAAIAALLISRLVWLPLLAPRRAAQAQLLEFQTRRHSVQRNLVMREAVERDFTALKDQLQKQRSNEEELSVFLRSLSQMFSGLALRVGEVRALPSEVQPFHKKHTVQIEVSGPMGSFARLLQEVSMSKLPIRVERFELAGGAADGRVDGTLWISELILLEQPASREGT
jgi:Tfp pilus assembly protein PilO